MRECKDRPKTYNNPRVSVDLPYLLGNCCSPATRPLYLAYAVLAMVKIVGKAALVRYGGWGWGYKLEVHVGVK